MELEKLNKITNADLNESSHQEYKEYEFVIGYIDEQEGLDVCYVWDVEEADSRVDELSRIIPDDTTIAAIGNVLGWDYGTFGSTVSKDKRVKDCRKVIDSLS